MSPTLALLSEAAPAPQLSARANLPVISAAGVNDVSALARQQLPSAVPAASLIAAYNAAIQQQQKPTTTRSSVAPPSSALAAQFIAQEALSSEVDLAIFTPRPPGTQSNQAPEDDYLRDLRMARGEVAALQKAESRNPRATAAAQPPTPATAFTAATQPAEQSLRTGFSQIAASLPALMLRVVKRPTLFNARGVSAYQLATTRNADLKTVAAT